jgi:hypothetical protein
VPGWVHANLFWLKDPDAVNKARCDACCGGVPYAWIVQCCCCCVVWHQTVTVSNQVGNVDSLARSPGAPCHLMITHLAGSCAGHGLVNHYGEVLCWSGGNKSVCCTKCGQCMVRCTDVALEALEVCFFSGLLLGCLMGSCGSLLACLLGCHHSILSGVARC